MGKQKSAGVGPLNEENVVERELARSSSILKRKLKSNNDDNKQKEKATNQAEQDVCVLKRQPKSNNDEEKEKQESTLENPPSKRVVQTEAALTEPLLCKNESRFVLFPLTEQEVGF
jgi:hypothetical protein